MPGGRLSPTLRAGSQSGVGAGLPAVSEGAADSSGSCSKSLAAAAAAAAAFSLDDVSSMEELLQMRDTLKLRLNKSYVKMSKVADLLVLNETI